MAIVPPLNLWGGETGTVSQAGVSQPENVEAGFVTQDQFVEGE